MDKKLLFEELEKFKLFSNYKPNMTLTENEVILEQGGPGDEQDLSEYTPGYLKGNSSVKKGELNFSGVMKLGMGDTPSYAKFKNKGMFYRYSKNTIFSITSVSPVLSIGSSNPPTPKPVEIKAVPISISTKVEDPFKFDKTVLYPEAEESLQKFFQDIKNVKNDYSEEVYKKFIEFLVSSKPITINAYASKDGNPETKITGAYTPCKNSGTRGKYDQCLSQARADYIKSRVEAEFPELIGVFTAIGHGQSTKFSGTGWPKSKNTDETKKDRRFDITLPTYEEKTEEPVVNTDVEDVIVDVGLGKKTNVWKISEMIPELPNATLNYSKDPNGFIVVSRKQITEVLGDLEYKYLAYKGPEDLNGSVRADVVLTPDSISVTSRDGTMVWKNWQSATQANVFDVTAALVTNVLPAVYKVDGDDCYIKGFAFALMNLSA